MARRTAYNYESPVVAALDVGTSSCRASLYDARGRRLAGTQGRIRYSPITTPDGGAEFDADALLQSVAATIDQATQRAGPALASVRAVAVSVFWHSLVGADADGCAVTPVYTWLDARSRAAAATLRRQLDERAVHARTGCRLHWSYWPARLLWLQQSQPDVFRRVRRWLSFGEYLTLRLFGRAETSLGMASATGLVDQYTGNWDAELLSALDLDQDALPSIGGDAPFTGLRPAYADRWPALREVPWLPAMGDGACSNLGSGCATSERLALTIGTSGALRALWRGEPRAIPWGAWGYRVGEQRFVLGCALNDGGSLFAWLRAALRLPPISAAEAQLVGMEPDAHGLTVLPSWAGERSPDWALDAKGAIVGLRLSTTPADILRAAMEAVALLVGRFDAILRPAVPEVRQVLASGAALLRSPAWLQMMADVLGRPVLASTEREASSRGAALLALERLGLLTMPMEGLPPPIERVYEPRPACTERYRAAAERQERLYRLLVEDA